MQGRSKNINRSLKLLIIIGITIMLLSVLKLNNKSSSIQVVNHHEAIECTFGSDYEDYTLDELYNLNDNNCEVIFEPGTNNVKEINGKFSTNKVTNANEALRALLNVRSLFGITSFDYFCSEIDAREDLTVFTLNQLYTGITVEGGFFQIGVDEQGTTSFVRGKYIEVKNIQMEPQISYDKGINNLNLNKNENIQQVELIVYGLENSQPCLCWKYTIKTTDPVNDRVIYLDAITGAVVYTYNMNIA